MAHRAVICRGAEIALGLVFVGAGFLKLRNPELFMEEITRYRLLPGPAWGAGLALSLPWFELLCGGALMLNRGRRGALLGVAGLLGAFLLALGAAGARGLDIRCGCFGGAGHSVPVAVALDLFLLGVTLFLLRRATRPPAGSPPPGPHAPHRPEPG